MSIERLNCAVFWFRKDLRIEDNRALYEALSSGLTVIPIYIFDETSHSSWSTLNDSQKHIAQQHLLKIDTTLKSVNSKLSIFYDTPINVFIKLNSILYIKAIYTNTLYEFESITQDESLRTQLRELNISFYRFKDRVVFEELEICKSDHSPYTVFTPYKKQWLNKLTNNQLNHYPSEALLTKTLSSSQMDETFQDLLPLDPKTESEFTDFKIDYQLISNYHHTRDLPYLKTSQIGSHLALGSISIRWAIKNAINTNEIWLEELIWRDFFTMILSNFPYTDHLSFKKGYDMIPWRNNELEFEKWKNGTTGIPLVDAGMRELNATGFMHNRVRMVVASFLCKNLLIDWRWGEAYFAEKLIDYDKANNIGNWQWSVGSGCDASPYFRVFNPITQQKRFDKEMTYIKKWIPEIETSNYPLPIIDIKESSKRAITIFKQTLQNYKG